MLSSQHTHTLSLANESQRSSLLEEAQQVKRRVQKGARGHAPLTVACDTRSCPHTLKQIGAFPWPLPWTRTFVSGRTKRDFTHFPIANQESKMSTSTVEKSGLWISLSSLFRPVTSCTHKQSLSDIGRWRFTDALSSTTSSFPNRLTIRRKRSSPSNFVGHPPFWNVGRF